MVLLKIFFSSSSLRRSSSKALCSLLHKALLVKELLEGFLLGIGWLKGECEIFEVTCYFGVNPPSPTVLPERVEAGFHA